MSRRMTPLLRVGVQATKLSVRHQWQQLPVTSPASHCLCRHLTNAAITPTTPKQPSTPTSHLPPIQPYRSPVHFIPPSYQPSTASTQPFTFALLYRHPPHHTIEHTPAYDHTKPLQFLLKLCQPPPPQPHYGGSGSGSVSGGSGVVWEVVLCGDLSVAELERVLVSNLHWLASVQLAVKGKVVPQSAAIDSLYGKSTISLLLHPHHGSAYSVPINGGLPLSRGVQSYISRHRIVYLSAVILVITLILQANEEKPTQHTNTAQPTTDDSKAQERWQQMVKAADDKVRSTLFSDSDDPKK